ncbi:ABC transporter ATP-binding protein [Vallitalea sp.]|jgi:ABC-type bacteriocin/lantibiotic exporter with double-glycine peptidase domain|uniref:ABC transporter ATP-binding protein n=1 Tax=Vallitalea sp. TaxID=1882829 RepID=UPI0025EE8394|nr:ABC transporter ATP-binding protein [Vallitalea sp.]MCT4686732.1 ABC transporter ATP-binding protein/permease [Vallitalea sp.]
MKAFNINSRKVTERVHIYNSIRCYLTKDKGLVMGIILLKVLYTTSSLIQPYFYKVFIDEVLTYKKITYLWWIIIGYLIIYLINAIIEGKQLSLYNQITNHLTFKLKRDLLNKYLKFSITDRDKFTISDMKIRIDTDTDAFGMFIKDYTIEYIYSWIYSIILMIAILCMNWKLTLFSLCIIPISFYLTKKFGKAAQTYQEEYRNKFGSYEEWLNNVLHNWKEIKSFNIEEKQVNIFTKMWGDISKSYIKRNVTTITYNCIIVLKDFFLSKMSLYILGGLLIIKGELSVGALLVYLKFFEMFIANISNINNTDMKLKSNLPCLQRVIDILTFPEIEYPARKQISLKGNIEFSDIYFRYDKTRDYILKDINFTVNPNESIAIIGESGCGKTTLIKLLLNLYTAEKGDILIDRYSIHTLNPKDLYRNIGVVMQETYLFNTTIKDNLLFANPKANDLEIKNACKKAFIHDFIESLPDGYNTVIGENGVKLSGGQRQRIAIAKVLLYNPNILIFDEATSSLDYESEKMVHQAIQNLLSNKTVIIIAHRLSSIFMAEKVAILSNGIISTVGTHKDLYENNSYYRRLIDQHDRKSIIYK